MIIINSAFEILLVCFLQELKISIIKEYKNNEPSSKIYRNLELKQECSKMFNINISLTEVFITLVINQCFQP